MTQYRIDHESEMSGLWSGVAVKQCTPCITCGPAGNKDRTFGWIWYFFASKMLMFAVHLCTIVFGVVKVRRRQLDANQSIAKDFYSASYDSYASAEQCSGAGTNSKVGWGGGSPPLYFGSTSSISRFC